MKNSNVFVIALVCLSILGFFLFFLGSNINALANSAIKEWYPKREWACWEHSGEFSELFSLRDLGTAFMSFGVLILLVVASIIILPRPLEVL